jgi:hypothetical protein
MYRASNGSAQLPVCVCVCVCVGACVCLCVCRVCVCVCVWVSSIHMYKNDVGPMYSRRKKKIFFLFHKLNEHIPPPLPTSFLYISDILLT